MYRIIGGDQREYGPVSVEELRRWIIEGRLHANSLVRPEGAAEWKPLSSFPELAALLSAAPAPFAAGAPGTLPVQQSNSMATLGLALSCVSLVCCGCGGVLGILGIVFSCIGLSQSNRDPAQTGRGVAIAGLVIGIISILGNIVALFMGAFGTLLEEILKR